MNWKLIVLGSFGAVFLLLGMILPLLFPILMESKLDERLMITPGGASMESFKETPVPIYFQVYFYNVTNSEEVLDGDKPVLQQVGPYTYLQKRVKHNITFDHEKGTVFYQEQKIYFFQPDMSPGSEDDLVTTLNPVYIAFASKGDSLNYVLRTAISWYTMMFTFEPFVTKKAGELTFAGYEDEVVADLYQKTGKPKYKEGRAGYFYGKNGSLDDGMEIFSGEKGMHNYQHIYKWHGQTELDFWKFAYNNMINGTSGSQFPRPIDTSTPLFMFSGDLCRSIYLRYEKDVPLGPLNLHRFSITEDVLAKSPQNAGFCKEEFTCRGAMIDASKCRDGVPIVMSTPHFYLGDAEDLEMVDGLEPQKEEHETFIDIEPNTGVALRAAKRMQVNMMVRPSSALGDLDYVEPVIFPVLWVNESVQVPMPRVEVLAETLMGPKAMANYLAIALVVVGLSIIVAACAIHCCCTGKANVSGKQRQQATDKTPNDVNIALTGTKNGTEKA